MGVLLLHGFTGAPPEMRRLGDYLHERGMSVAAPLLRGHGTTESDLNQCKWSDWADDAKLALDQMRSQCDRVYVAGLSMGAMLTLHLAANQQGIDGAISLAPALGTSDPRALLLPFIKYFVHRLPKPPDYFADPSAQNGLWCYEKFPAAATHEVMKFIAQVKDQLPRVMCPLLVVHSTADRSVHPASAKSVYEGVASELKELLTLHTSGHVLTLDSEWRTVADRMVAFIDRISSGQDPAR